MLERVEFIFLLLVSYFNIVVSIFILILSPTIRICVLIMHAIFSQGLLIMLVCTFLMLGRCWSINLN